MNSLHDGRPSGSDSGVSGRLLLAASAVLLSLAGAFFFLPMLYVAPAPLAALVYRHGYRSGIVTAVFILLAVGAGQQQLLGATYGLLDPDHARVMFLAAMTVVVTVGLIGIVIGGAWREGAGRWRTLWLGTAGGVLPAAGLAVALWFLRDVDLLQTAFDAWVRVMKVLVEQTVAAGMPTDAAAELFDMLAQSEASFPFVKPLVPGIVFIGALVGSWANGGLAAWVLSRSEPKAPPSPAFITWRFPWPFALAFVLGHALSLAARLQGSAAAGIVGENLLMVSSFVFFLQGVAILLFVFEMRQTNVFVRIVAVAALAWLWPQVLTWFGVLDTWFQFRSRRRRAGGRDGGHGRGD